MSIAGRGESFVSQLEEGLPPFRAPLDQNPHRFKRLKFRVEIGRQFGPITIGPIEWPANTSTQIKVKHCESFGGLPLLAWTDRFVALNHSQKRFGLNHLTEKSKLLKKLCRARCNDFDE